MPQKGTIVFIHGSSSSKNVFNQILQSADIKNTKIANDLIGHGENQIDSENISDFSLEANCKALIKQINQIDDDILLVGNSIGGHIAIEIAEKIQRLKGLVIMSTPPVKKPINFEEVFVAVPALNTFLTPNPPEKEVETASEVVVVDKSFAQNIVTDFKQTNPLVRAATANDLMSGNLQDEFKIFTELKVPTFIIAGEQDPSINKIYLKKVSAASINCRFYNVENCGHYPSLEKPIVFENIMAKVVKQIF